MPSRCRPTRSRRGSPSEPRGGDDVLATARIGQATTPLHLSKRDRSREAHRLPPPLFPEESRLGAKGRTSGGQLGGPAAAAAPSAVSRAIASRPLTARGAPAAGPRESQRFRGDPASAPRRAPSPAFTDQLPPRSTFCAHLASSPRRVAATFYSADARVEDARGRRGKEDKRRAGGRAARLGGGKGTREAARREGGVGGKSVGAATFLRMEPTRQRGGNDGAAAGGGTEGGEESGLGSGVIERCRQATRVCGACGRLHAAAHAGGRES